MVFRLDAFPLLVLVVLFGGNFRFSSYFNYLVSCFPRWFPTIPQIGATFFNEGITSGTSTSGLAYVNYLVSYSVLVLRNLYFPRWFPTILQIVATFSNERTTIRVSSWHFPVRVSGLFQFVLSQFVCLVGIFPFVLVSCCSVVRWAYCWL